MAKEEFSVTIKGFKTKVEANEFMNWYMHQGEHFIDNWMDGCREADMYILSDAFLTKSIDYENGILILED